MQKIVSKTAMAIFTMLFAQTAIANDVLYCTSELATGIVKKKGSWVESSFKPERFTIKFADDFSSVNHPVLDGIMKCHTPLSFKPELIECSGFFHSLSFNKESMRFVFFVGSSGGYVYDLPDSDTESLYAGTCERF